MNSKKDKNDFFEKLTRKHFIGFGLLLVMIIICIASGYSLVNPYNKFSTLSIGLVSSLMASLIFTALYYLFFQDSVVYFKEKIVKKCDELTKSINDIKDISDIGIKIHKKDTYDNVTNFWKSLLIGTSYVLELNGRSLSKWSTDEEYKKDFFKKIREIIATKDGKVRLLIWDVFNSTDIELKAKVQNVLKNFYEEFSIDILKGIKISNISNELDKKNIIIRCSKKNKMHYLYNRYDTKVLIQPYLSTSEKGEGLLVEIKYVGDNNFAKIHVDDFEIAFKNSEAVKWDQILKKCN